MLLNEKEALRRENENLKYKLLEKEETGKIIYLDLIADDWVVVDVVAEVNKQQEQILKDRNEH